MTVNGDDAQWSGEDVLSLDAHLSLRSIPVSIFSAEWVPYDITGLSSLGVSGVLIP